MKKKYELAKDRVKLSTGDVIKIAREMLEMTQAELAKKSGISASHLSEIESGIVEIGRQRALALAKVLHVPAPYIMFPTANFYLIKKVA